MFLTSAGPSVPVHNSITICRGPQTVQPCNLKCENTVLSFQVSITCSPWYNCTGWLGIKHQLTYLLPKLALCIWTLCVPFLDLVILFLSTPTPTPLGYLMSSPCLESEGCHLIKLFHMRCPLVIPSCPFSLPVFFFCCWPFLLPTNVIEVRWKRRQYQHLLPSCAVVHTGSVGRTTFCEHVCKCYVCLFCLFEKLNELLMRTGFVVLQFLSSWYNRNGWTGKKNQVSISLLK